MASDQQSDRRRTATAHEENAPDWADGLKQLYDAVVEEPLPDAFKDLLDRFDDEEPSGKTESSSAS